MKRAQVALFNVCESSTCPTVKLSADASTDEAALVKAFREAWKKAEFPRDFTVEFHVDRVPTKSEIETTIETLRRQGLPIPDFFSQDVKKDNGAAASSQPLPGFVESDSKDAAGSQLSGDTPNAERSTEPTVEPAYSESAAEVETEINFAQAMFRYPCDCGLMFRTKTELVRHLAECPKKAGRKAV